MNQTNLYLSHLVPGDWVCVWDGVAERDVWVELADVRIIDNSRVEMRAVGSHFYFSSALVTRHSSECPAEAAA